MLSWTKNSISKDSPSCGSTTVYDGSFTGKIVPGSGVTAQLLNDNGIKVFNELELYEADIYMRSLEVHSNFL